MNDPMIEPGTNGDPAHWVARTLGRRDFALLSADDVAALDRALRTERFETGVVLFKQGLPSKAAYILRTGEVELVSTRGRKKITLGVAREGEVLGDVSLLCGTPYSFSAIARTPGSALRLPGEDLIPLLKRHPAIALRWLMSAVQRVDRTTRRLVEMTGQDLRGRVLAFLADELRARGMTEGESIVPIGQETLASMVGASRQSVNRLLGTLRDEGLLEAGYGRLTIRDAEQLLGAR